MLFIEFISFLIFVITCAYLPGRYLSFKLKFKLAPHEELFFATGFGLITFTLLSYMFSWIHLAIIVVPILLIIDFLTIKNKKFLPAMIDKQHIKPLIVVALMSILFVSYMLILGIHGNTITFRADDLWHLALQNEMKVNFPPDNPSYAQVPLRGYHFFYDFMNANISNDFLISPFTLHFFLIPILNAFLWGFGVYSLMYKWSKKISSSLFAVFLTISGGSFAYVLALTGHPGFNLISSLGVDQPLDSLYNPPYAMSIIILILIFFGVHEYLSTKNNLWLVPITLFVGLISIFKVYGGIIAIAVFGVLFLHELVKRRFIIIPAAVVSGILFLTTYWYFVGGTGSLLFYPLWAPYRVMQTFPWYHFDNKMYIFNHEHVIKGIITTNLDALSIFTIGNLGTRIIGILLLPIIYFKTRRGPSFFALLLLTALAVSYLIPLFFIQTGQVFETIQIDWYFLFFASLFASLGLGEFFELKFNKVIKIVLLIIFIFATIPSTYAQLVRYPQTIASAQSLSDPNFSAMNYLAHQGNYDQTVLEIPDKSVTPTDENIKFWYNGSTPTIPAFGNKRSYYNGELNNFPLKNVETRVTLLKNAIRLVNGDSSLKDQVLKSFENNNIVFILSHEDIQNLKDIPQIKKVYQKGPETIYKVSQ